MASPVAWQLVASSPNDSVKQDIVRSKTLGQEMTATSPSTGPFPITIRKPTGPPRVRTGITDAHGENASVACSTCHASRVPNRQNKAAVDLNEFHQGMSFSHGALTCLSCHSMSDYDTLQLADASQLAFQDVMTLCSQCHGTQRRDFDHGAHGGMNGFWDLSRGPRTRNNCVDCHDPHRPQFPKMQPTFKPRDRFLSSEAREHHEP